MSMKPMNFLRALLLFALAACTTPGPQQYQSFFAAVEAARQTGGEPARVAFEAACSQSSSAACHRLGESVEATAPMAILQGATDESGTEIIVLVPNGQTIQVFLWDRGTDVLIEPRGVFPIELPAGMGKIVQYQYEGLNRSTTYQFQVVGPAGELLDGREFETLDVLQKQGTIAVASCMENTHPEQKAMWESLVGQDPDAIFLIGDNVYADSEGPAPNGVEPAVLWRRYIETRRDLELFKIRKLIPVFAVWDDHDYGKNDGDATYPHKDEAKKVFQAFFGGASFPGVYDHGPGVSSRLNAFGQRFFFLDDRSFRSPPSDKEGETHFGVDQESWMFTEIFGDVPVWMITGNQFFGGYHPFESYEGKHPASFARFLRRLQAQSAPVIFLSGDRHLAELMEIGPEMLGYRTFEITTSSIHGKLYPDPWVEHPNPRKIEGISGVNNYAILETNASHGLTVGVRIYGPAGRRLFSRTLELKK